MHKQPSEKSGASEEAAEGARYIVGIGASAGGFEAFEKFFDAMPDDSGLAFVLVSHLDPSGKSLMAELLARRTTMAVFQAEDSILVEPNQVYVAPPGTGLTLEDRRLRVTLQPRPSRPAISVDAFFRSLADAGNEHAIGIVLSGTGTDGTLGLKAIKEHGGLTLVQEPATAKYDDMPRSAIATGLVDRILPVEEMPQALIEYTRQIGTVPDGTESGRRLEIISHLPAIFRVLRNQTGQDFTEYKHNTIIRRIERRMSLLQIDRTLAYVEHLRNVPEEVRALFKDLLIGVTHFFRNPKAFATLDAEVIQPLFTERRDDRPIRVWVPGCATGEEAYSIAILIAECMTTRDGRVPVQIFATDIDESTLEIGRAGKYPESIAADVSPERLERFFLHEGNTYQIAKRIRTMMVFSLHNLIKDPPFSKLDLVSCRNVLIYLNAELQHRLIPLFHYALNPQGSLFLGPSETLSKTEHLFSTMHKKHRLFHRKTIIPRPAIHFPATAHEPTGAMFTKTVMPKRLTELDLSQVADRVLLDSYAPASAVIDTQQNVVLFHGHTGRYLEAPSGAPDLNILRMARRGLRLKLQAAIHRVRQHGHPVIENDVGIRTENGIQRIKLVVKPLSIRGQDAGLLMVIFEDLASDKAFLPASANDPTGNTETRTETMELESELHSTREFLQATIEEMEATNEELKSSNEELLSMNEELQSTNEELETAQEESQSINEELETVNAELRRKVEELDHAKSDMINLLSCTQIATIFLGTHLHIRSFTPAITDIFSLIPSDIGRPITDIAQRITYANLDDDVREVLRTLAAIGRQVRSENEWYLMRIMPYRTVDNVIDGVVITFVDITQLKQIESELRTTQERLRFLIATTPGVLYTCRAEGDFGATWVSDDIETLTGYKAHQFVDNSSFWTDHIHPDDKERVFADLNTLQDQHRYEYRFRCRDGTYIWVRGALSLIRNEKGDKPSEIVGYWSDITQRKAEQEAHE